MMQTSPFSLPSLVAGAIAVALNVYLLTGGADFGGGLWDLLASGPRREQQRALIADAIGPIWEANHVWLILVVVLLFTGFPVAFARLMTTLHIPLSLMLLGIVLRGSAFTFRSYDSRRDTVQRRWSRLFAIASTATPVLLGLIVGAVASGNVREPPSTRGTFAAAYVWPWLSPFTLGVGVLALALFAFLAATYLTVEAEDTALREDFRRRALAVGLVVLVIASADLLVAAVSVPRMWSALSGGVMALAFHLATGVAAAVAIAALWTRRYRHARTAAGIQASLILWGWVAGQYPYIVPPDLTVAAAPSVTLELLCWTLGVGLLVLIPSLRHLFRVFKGEQKTKLM
jgi:cytochrome d ubiquinol oxidase subunit II